VIRASVNREPLAKALKLRPEQRITLAQTVGTRRRGPDVRAGTSRISKLDGRTA